MSGSWVTMTTVVPSSAFTRWMRSTIVSRSVCPSCEVGSSASSRPAPLDTVTASATRCCSPPDIALTGSVGQLAEPQHLQQLPRRRQAAYLGRGHRAPGEGDVARRGGVRQQVAAGALEQRGDLAGAQPGELGLGDAADVDAVDDDLASRGALEPAEEPEQRGLARARRAEQGDLLARGDVEVHPAQRDDVVARDAWCRCARRSGSAPRCRRGRTPRRSSPAPRHWSSRDGSRGACTRRARGRARAAEAAGPAPRSARRPGGSRRRTPRPRPGRGWRAGRRRPGWPPSAAGRPPGRGWPRRARWWARRRAARRPPGRARGRRRPAGAGHRRARRSAGRRARRRRPGPAPRTAFSVASTAATPRPRRAMATFSGGGERR